MLIITVTKTLSSKIITKIFNIVQRWSFMNNCFIFNRSPYTTSM